MRDACVHPRTLPAVKGLTAGFEHHPINDAPLPAKHASCGRLPGALTEANLGVADGGVAIPVVDTIECIFNMSESMEPRTLTDAISHPDAALWIAAALAEIGVHLENSMWELAQLPLGRRAIGSHWVFKVKWKPDRLIDKYKGHIITQGFSQLQGIHYNKVFVSMACMAVMRVVITMAATEDLELDSVDVLTAFLNGKIDVDIYMKIPDGLSVEGRPGPGEDPKRWVVQLLKGLYSIKQGPCIWALKLHSVLTGIGFEQTNCDHLVYVYWCDGICIMLPIHVDDLLLASNSREVLQCVKSELGSHFKLHDLGPATSILGMKIVHDHTTHTINLSQLGYIRSILNDFNMSDCNPCLTPMGEGTRLSMSMSPQTPEERLGMKAVLYRKLVGKLLYLTVATCLDIAYVVGVPHQFVKNPREAHWNVAKHVPQ